MPEVLPLCSLEEFNKAIGVNSDDESFAVIDFWATWCGPCRFISPVFEKIASEDQSSKVKYYKVDVDEAKDIAAAAQISVMPTFIVYKKGAPIESLKGANPGELTKLVTKCQSP